MCIVVPQFPASSLSPFVWLIFYFLSMCVSTSLTSDCFLRSLFSFSPSTLPASSVQMLPQYGCSSACFPRSQLPLGQHLHAPSLSGSYSRFITVMDTSKFPLAWLLASASPLASAITSLDLALSSVLPFSHDAATHTHWSMHPVYPLNKCMCACFLFLPSTLALWKHALCCKTSSRPYTFCLKPTFWYSVVFTQSSFD